MNRKSNAKKNNYIKLLLFVVFIIAFIITINNTISSYENIANNSLINGLISKLDGNKVRVIFNPMGGILDVTDKVFNVGDQYGTLPKPTKDGYIFEYWYINDESDRIKTNTVVNESKNVFLKAKYVDKNNIAILKKDAFRLYNGSYLNVINATELRYYDGIPADEIISGAKVISDDSSVNKAYAWVDGNTMYYWSDKPIYMQNDMFGSNSTNWDYVYTSYKKFEIIDLSKINTLLVDDMSNLFRRLPNLLELYISGFDTSNVKDMSYMFYGCVSLNNVDLSSFDTGNVTDMSNMFESCYSFTELNVSSFNTIKVKNMSSMFAGSKNLTSLDLSNFNTSNVTSMYFMFGGGQTKGEDGNYYYSVGLEHIDLSSFDTSNVTSIGYMFYGCHKIQSLDLSSFDTSKVTDMAIMFCGCESLKNLDLSNFNTSNVNSMYHMFAECDSIEYLNLANFDISSITEANRYQMRIFYNIDKSFIVYLDCIKAVEFKNYISSNYSNVSISCI